MGFWAVWGCTLSEVGEQDTAELLNPGHHWFCPTIDHSGGCSLLHTGLASELSGMLVTRLPTLAIAPDVLS